MKIRIFTKLPSLGWEINFIGKVYNLRIAKHQFAFWKNYEPIFSFSYGWKREKVAK